MFASNNSLVKGQFRDETRDGGLGFDEISFIILQLYVPAVVLRENVSLASNVLFDGLQLFC